MEDTMTTIYVDLLAWQALDADAQRAAIEAAEVPVLLGTPAEQTGSFNALGDFIPSTTGTVWAVWDDPRLTESHAISLASAIL